MNSILFIIKFLFVWIEILNIPIECLNKLPKVKTLILIFGLILVGCLLVSNFLAMLTNHLESSDNRKKLMFL